MSAKRRLDLLSSKVLLATPSRDLGPAFVLRAQSPRLGHWDLDYVGLGILGEALKPKHYGCKVKGAWELGISRFFKIWGWDFRVQCWRFGGVGFRVQPSPLKLLHLTTCCPSDMSKTAPHNPERGPLHPESLNLTPQILNPKS